MQEMKTLLLFSSILLLVWLCLSSVSAAATSSHRQDDDDDPLKLILGNQNLGPLRSGLLDGAQAPGPAPQKTLLLAANRTKRPDILHGFKQYRGGWDISNKSYWASVGFTGAIGFIFAILWFFTFGVILMVRHCCGWGININGTRSERSKQICLILLILFTCASAIGCILLSVGQFKFHAEVLHTLNYVVNQSDYTAQTLKNVTEYLSLAKSISLAQVILPSDLKDEINKLSVDLNTAAEMLTEKTDENAIKIKKVFSIMRSTLVTVAAVMLLLSLLGLVLSLLRHQHAIYIFIVSGWLLVAVTFILCGVFVIFNNVISDTCTAMQEWVENPQAETALSNILPCVDERTTNQTLKQSNEVVGGIVNAVNEFVWTYANTNRNPSDPFYYNQSGPTMPPLCYPFDNQMHDRDCGSWEVSMNNASEVWRSYVCMASGEVCTTVGRLTPSMYDQLVAAVNVSYAINHYTPPMLSLQNCDFVRGTFMVITSSYCPPLEHDLQMVNTGLGLISAGVVLCLILWILISNRPRREEVFVKYPLQISGSSRSEQSNGRGKDGGATPSPGMHCTSVV